jgi:hypothetical protein
MAITWAQRLKRVFNIEIEVCRHCQGPVKMMCRDARMPRAHGCAGAAFACIEDPAVIAKILACLNSKANANATTIQTEFPLLPMPRAPPTESEWLWPTGHE